MARPASFPGWSLESCGDAGPRGMAAHDRTRLIGRLPLHLPARSIGPPGAASTLILPLAGEAIAAESRRTFHSSFSLRAKVPAGRMRAALDLRAGSRRSGSRAAPFCRFAASSPASGGSRGSCCAAPPASPSPEAGEGEAAACAASSATPSPARGRRCPAGADEAALDLRRGLLLAQRIPDTALRAATLREMLQSFQHLAARS